MRVILRRPAQPPDAGSVEPTQTYRLKPRSFLVSFLIHASVAAVLLVPGIVPPAPAERPVLESIVLPQKDHIVWYHLQAALPNIDSSTIPVPLGPNRGRLQSPQLVIAQSKDGSPTQFVWQDTPAELPARAKAPNLIAAHTPAPEPEPAAPAPAPKLPQFVPPPVAPTLQPEPAAALPLPAGPVTVANPQLPATLPQAVSLGPQKIYRPFVAPPQTKSGNGTGSGQGTALTSVPDAPIVGTGSNVDVAAINLESLGVTSSLPPGRRPGNFSAGPNVGAPSAEKGGGGALVPGLTTRGTATGNSEPAIKTAGATPDIPKKAMTYRELSIRPMGSSLSAPLQPGARRIPAVLDLQFHDRTLYTIIFPQPKMPQYAGDWVLWFSELKPSPSVVQMRAPVPEMKLVPETAPASSSGTEVDVRINLLIDENGRVQSLSVARIPAGFSAQAALDDVRAWQFKPATRNGVPVAVEAVLDIPFRQILWTGQKN
jgi:TonB family protein